MNARTGHLTIIALCCMFYSCASIVPVSNEIIERVGGETELDKFQYYISRGIVMDRTENETDAGIVAGQAKIVNKTRQDRIKIKRSTPGVVIHSRFHPNIDSYSLCVAFEADDDKYLQFVSYSGGEVYALYTPIENENIVAYGTALYRYSPINTLIPPKKIETAAGYDYSDMPCLLIKLKKRDIIKKNRRTAKGRRIGR